jgi:hypothetical protein
MTFKQWYEETTGNEWTKYLYVTDTDERYKLYNSYYAYCDQNGIEKKFK